MRIVIISDWFSEQMGYAPNCLPKALSKLGHEVHVITSTAQVYYNIPNYDITYKQFLGDAIVKSEVKKIDGYTLYRNNFSLKNGYIKINGIKRLLIKLRPDVVQTFDNTSINTFNTALIQSVLGFKLFTSYHGLKSVFPLAQKDFWPYKRKQYPESLIPIKLTYYGLKRFIYSNFKTFSEKEFRQDYINSTITKCIAPTEDSADIVVSFFGVPKNKIVVSLLGVDTDVYFPFNGIEKNKKVSLLREKFNLPLNKIICIYTGRFSENKNPLCLAEAIELLNKEKPNKYCAVFIGDGIQKKEISQIENCFCIPFLTNNELADFYRLSDIGCWPREESTSVLDASACGLPVVISNKVIAAERAEGNGLMYIENDSRDMAKTLLELESIDYRNKLGEIGVNKINSGMTWNQLTERRLNEYYK